MKKRALTAAMALALVMAMTGCGNTGANTESATAATTQEAAAEVAAEEEWMTNSTAYLSGINAVDYVELPANYSSLTVEVEPVKEVTDEEVEDLINKEREARRELKEVTNRKKVKEGDVVNTFSESGMTDSNDSVFTVPSGDITAELNRLAPGRYRCQFIAIDNNENFVPSDYVIYEIKESGGERSIKATKIIKASS